MPYVTTQVVPGTGPLIDLFVGVSEPRGRALVLAGKPIPSPISIRGLIDTGAGVTCIDPAILLALNLPPHGTIGVHTPSTAGTPHPVDQYDVSFTFPLPGLNWKIPAVAVIGAQLREMGIDALVGRDILDKALFIYSGASRTFLLGF